MKKLLLLCLAFALIFGTAGSVVPVSAQGVWTVWQESVFVGNERVFRLAPVGNLTALERAAIVHKRLAVLQENYPGFDAKRIDIIAFHWTPDRKYESGLRKGCPETKDFRDIHRKPGWRRYIVIGYYRAPGERPFSGEIEIGSYCAYRLVGDDKRYFKTPKFFAYFIPIVTVTPQDAELHGWGVYEMNLALEWAWNLQDAFAKLR